MKKVLLACTAALACGSAFAQSDIEAMDRGNVIPSFRLGFAVNGEAGPQGPAVPRTGHGIEIGLLGGSGDDSQTLSGGEFIRFGGQTFPSGQTVQHEYDYRFFEIAYRFRKFFGASQNFGIEALAGLGFAELDLTTTGPGRSANEKISNGGLLGGFGLIWKFHPSVYLHPRFTFFGSSDEEGISAAGHLDVQVAWAVARNIVLRGGVASVAFVSSRAEANNGNSPNSRIAASAGGVSLGLDVQF